jgi:hypothetical protein
MGVACGLVLLSDVLQVTVLCSDVCVQEVMALVHDVTKD